MFRRKVTLSVCPLPPFWVLRNLRTPPHALWRTPPSFHALGLCPSLSHDSVATLECLSLVQTLAVSCLLSSAGGRSCPTEETRRSTWHIVQRCSTNGLLNHRALNVCELGAGGWKRETSHSPSTRRILHGVAVAHWLQWAPICVSSRFCRLQYEIDEFVDTVHGPDTLHPLSKQDVM